MYAVFFRGVVFLPGVACACGCVLLVWALGRGMCSEELSGVRAVDLNRKPLWS